MMCSRITAIGEVLWDIFPDAAHFGGAPANFAAHAAALGADVRLISRVGADERGEQALSILRQLNVQPVGASVTPNFPTGSVQIEVDSNGVASYEFQANVAWDNLEWHTDAAECLQNSAAVCFGTLSQRSEQSRAVTSRLLDELPDETLVVFDVNLRQNFYSDSVIRQSLERSDVLKLNDEELPEVLNAIQQQPLSTRIRTLRRLLDLFGLKAVILTRGRGGSLLVTHRLEDEQPAIPVNVVDTVGAGDAFTAAMVLGMLQKKPLPLVHSFAAQVAAYVCSQAGAVPSLPMELKLFFTEDDR